jgi:hypothetical protein
MFELNARHLFALSLVGVFAAPLAAQSQPPFLEAETQHPLAATLPVIDLATEGERIAVASFDWNLSGPFLTEGVVTLLTRDPQGAVVEETVTEWQYQPFGTVGEFFLGMAGRPLVDLQSDAVVIAGSSWNMFNDPSGPPWWPNPVYSATGYVERRVRQANGTWTKEAITPVSSTQYALASDLAVTDELIVWSSGTVYAAEPALPSGWTIKGVTTATTNSPRVDTDGDIIVLGSEELILGSSSSPSRAEVWSRSAIGDWVKKQSLFGSSSVSGDRFGCDVSLDGNYIAVSAVLPGTSTFIAYLYERSPGTSGPWTEVAVLVPPAPFAPAGALPSPLDPNQRQSIVAVDGDRVVVSQPTSDVHFPSAGSADVFMRSPTGTWEHSVRLAPRASATNAFVSMDTDADRIVASTAGFAPAMGTFDVYDFGSLLAVGDGPSLTTAAPQTLAIDEGIENAGDAYAMLGSLTGTTPGVAVPTTPYTLPLVLDPYFAYALQSIGGGGLLSAPFGVLDNRGRATCDFTIPTGLPASLVGVSIFHAAVIFDLQAPGVPATHVTNPVTSVLVP